MRLFLTDRDGVINYDSPDYIKSPAEWEPIEGSIEGLSQLSRGGWKICVVSNQSALGRGLMGIEDLIAIHAKLQSLLNVNGAHIEAFFFCPHMPSAHCTCRKPAPGLLNDISQRFGISLEGTPFVGDTLKDVFAAKAVNARPILVRTGRGEESIAQPECPTDIEIYDNLALVASKLLLETSK